MSPKILVFDLESAPEIVYTFNRFDTSIGQTQVIHSTYVMCAAWSWVGESKVHTLGLHGSRAWNRGDRRNDKAVVRQVHALLDEADIVVGHNVKAFDLGMLNARFAVHDLKLPTPYKIVDTLSVLRRHFKIPSRSLESALAYFKLAVCKKKQGFELWRDCLAGLPEAWDKMLAYCGNDVTGTKALFEKLRPWVTSMNMGLYSEGSVLSCPKCGSARLQRRGEQIAQSRRYTRYHCQECGGWSKDPIASKGPGKHVLGHV